MRYVLGIDPGKMTGFAAYDLQAHELTSSWQADVHGAYASLEPWVPSSRLVAIERFVITGGTAKMGRGQENWSMELIGVARYLAFRADVQLLLQGAGDAKKFAPDARLKSIGWWNAGHDHANDAARHVLLALASQHPEELEGLQLFV